MVGISYPRDGDMEEMTFANIKEQVHRVDNNSAIRKKIGNEYILPFMPQMTQSLIEEADYYRGDKQHPILCNYFHSKNYPTKIYSRNDDWNLDFNKELKYKANPGDRPISRTNIQSDNNSAATFYRLQPGKFVNDEAVNRFSLLFNAEERKKLARDPENYIPSIMLQSWFTASLKDSDRNDRDTKWTWFNCSHRGSGMKGGRDIFTSVSKIYCPYNIDNVHWVLFVVDPNSLEQQLYDSLWGGLDSDLSTISRGIHDFLLEYHLATMMKEHPKKRSWTRSLVTYDHSILGTAYQSEGGMDCALHTCINAVLLQENVPMYLLSRDKEKVSNEMRVRMTLTVARNQWFFGVDSSRVEKMRIDHPSAPLDDGGTMLAKLGELNKSIPVSSKKGKKKKKRTPD